MANEFKIPSQTGLNIYSQILSPSAQRWNNSLLQFETYAAGNYANYSIALTEQGSSGAYVGSFPTTITTAGDYEIFYYRRLGGSPAQGDIVIGTGIIKWNGSSAVSGSVPNAMTGSEWLAYVLRVFKRTDKNTEVYEETGEVIREIRRRLSIGQDEQESTPTDTISALGDYRIETDDNLSLFVSDVVVLDGTDSQQLVRISKSEFDYLYPNPGATGVYKSKPLHYCIFADMIHLGPVPDRTTYQYKVSMNIDDYAAITSSTTAVPYSNKYKNMLRAGVLKRVFEGVEKYDTAQYWDAQFERFFAQLVDKEEHNRDAVHVQKYNDH